MPPIITTEQLAAHLNDPSWVIIDCRFALAATGQGASAYAEGHIPGARYAHLDNDLSGKIIPGVTGRHPLPDIDTFAAKLGAWGIDNNTTVVAYDDMGGPFAARLWSMLYWLGHQNVAVLDGGWPQWVAESRPTSTVPPSPEKKTFIPNPASDFLADVQEVEAVTRHRQLQLIDARAYERFAGETEPIDPVAGHIPSAVCYPWTENLDENKRFRSPEALRSRFKDINTAAAIAYCGSGVTAAHNLLAIAHAGLPLPRLYAGSWSEWIVAPDREIATG